MCACGLASFLWTVLYCKSIFHNIYICLFRACVSVSTRCIFEELFTFPYIVTCIFKKPVIAPSVLSVLGSCADTTLEPWSWLSLCLLLSGSLLFSVLKVVDFITHCEHLTFSSLMFLFCLISTCLVLTFIFISFLRSHFVCICHSLVCVLEPSLSHGLLRSLLFSSRHWGFSGYPSVTDSQPDAAMSETRCDSSLGPEPTLPRAAVSSGGRRSVCLLLSQAVAQFVFFLLLEVNSLQMTYIWI